MQHLLTPDQTKIHEFLRKYVGTYERDNSPNFSKFMTRLRASVPTLSCALGLESKQTIAYARIFEARWNFLFRTFQAPPLTVYLEDELRCVFARVKKLDSPLNRKHTKLVAHSTGGR